jgi:hypothetical protein
VSDVSDSMKTHPTTHGPLVGEQSTVRERGDEVTLVSRAYRPSARRHRGTVAERSARIAAKIRRAERLMRELRPADPRLRLLCSAILRKDEVLLDAVMRSRGGR